MKVQKRKVANEKTIKTTLKHLYQKGVCDRDVVKKATKMTREQFDKHQKGMAEKWPQPAYMNGQKGDGTKYKPETYETVTRWTEDTKIAYRPHAKSPGSKSHLRYERYGKAKTVGESLRLGSYPEDWCWDFERGFIQVVGGQIREEPLDLEKAEESEITEVDRALHSWYLRVIAKKFGMTSGQLSATKGSSESSLMRGFRLMAQQEAKARLEAAESAGRIISDEDIEVVLKRWPFFKNPHRKNVLPDNKSWVWSDTLGLLRDRIGHIHLTGSTRRYPQVTELFCRWLTDRLPKEAKGFTFTTINVNCNYAAKRHRDNGNFGPSMIKAFGSFTGGQLQYWPEDPGEGDVMKLSKDANVTLDIAKGLALFNGNCGHSVQKFNGSRYSVVYFTVSCHSQASKDDKAKLERLGFTYPKQDENPFDLIRPPQKHLKGSGSKLANSTSNPPWRYWLHEAFADNSPKTAAQIKKFSADRKKRRVQPETSRSFYVRGKHVMKKAKAKSQ